MLPLLLHTSPNKLLAYRYERTDNAVSDIDDTLEFHREIGLAVEAVNYIITVGFVVYLISELTSAPFINVN